jgi:MFS family permease
MQATDTSPAPSVLQELRRGWRPALGAVLAMSVGTSLYAITAGLFVKPLGAAFGWSRGEIGAGAFAGVLGAAAVPVAGWLSDRFGVRAVGAAGMLALVGLYIGLANMPGDIAIFYGLRAFEAVLGAGASAIVLSRPLAQAFERSRGLAIGAGLAFAAMLVMLMVPAVQATISSYGWRGGYYLLAAGPAVVGLGALFILIGPRPVATAQTAGGEKSAGVGLAEGIRDRRFWLMFLAMLTANLCFGGILGQLPALLSDAGMAGRNVGLVMSLLIGAAMVGRLVEGLLIDRIWPPLVALVTLLVPVAGLLLLLEPSASLPRAVLIVALLGFAQGGEASQLSFFIPRYFGFRAYGAIYGALAIGISLSMATGGAMFGFVFDRTGAYDGALLAAAAGLIVAALSMFATGFGGSWRGLNLPARAARPA